MSVFTFRTMLILSVFFAVAGNAFDLWLLPDAMPVSINEGFLQSLSLLNIIVIIIIGLALGISLILILGLYYFRWWAPFTNLIVATMAILLFAFSDTTVTSCIAQACFALSQALTGAVLACAYWSPISKRFVKKSRNYIKVFS